VQHIAKLARLGLTEKEIGKFQKELSSILDYIEKLKEVDISKVQPTSHSITRALAKGGDTAAASSIEMENVTRDDIENDASLKLKIKNKKLLKLAPETKDGYLKVKSIMRALAKREDERSSSPTRAFAQQK